VQPSKKSRQAEKQILSDRLYFTLSLLHVPAGVHLPIWKGTFEISNTKEIYLYIIYIQIFIHIPLRQLINFATYKTECTFIFEKCSSFIENSVDLCYFTQHFSHKKFRGTCSSVEGCMVRERLGTSVLEQCSESIDLVSQIKTWKQRSQTVTWRWSAIMKWLKKRENVSDRHITTKNTSAMCIMQVCRLHAAAVSCFCWTES